MLRSVGPEAANCLRRPGGRSREAPPYRDRSDFVRWPNAELVQRLPSRQLLGVKLTRCAHCELFRV
jgi:hypothetical protein